MPDRRHARASAPKLLSSSPTSGRTIDLTIPNDVGEIEGVVERVRRECEAMHYGERQLMLNLPVALTEALSNAILRGNADDPRKHVRVRAHVDHAMVVIEVSDEGVGFNLDACTVDPTTPERINREDGRGLFLMRSLMDRVECVGQGPGTVVRLTLRRAS